MSDMYQHGYDDAMSMFNDTLAEFQEKITQLDKENENLRKHIDDLLRDLDNHDDYKCGNCKFYADGVYKTECFECRRYYSDMFKPKVEIDKKTK